MPKGLFAPICHAAKADMRLLVGEQLLAVGLGLDLLRLEDFLYLAFLVDDECGAESAEIFSAIHRFLAPDAEGFDQFVVHIGYEREGQLVLFDEFAVRLVVIDAHTEHLISLGLQAVVVVAEAARFCRAPGGEVFGIEIEYEFSAFEIAEADFLAVFVVSQQFGSHVANVHIILGYRLLGIRLLGIRLLGVRLFCLYAYFE